MKKYVVVVAVVGCEMREEEGRETTVEEETGHDLDPEIVDTEEETGIDRTEGTNSLLINNWDRVLVLYMYYYPSLRPAVRMD